jgi:hypothetical protein
MEDYKKPLEVGVLFWVVVASWALAATFFGLMAVGLFVAVFMPESKSTIPFPWSAVFDCWHLGAKALCIGFVAFWAARLVDKVHETHHIVKQLEIHK